ncbi:MAG: hypothetical protein EOO44_17425, partial [Flavobacterium sp.]
MKLINYKEFKSLLENFEPETLRIENLHIDLEEPLSFDLRWQSFYFNNCMLTGERLDFYINQKNDNEYQSIQFVDCSVSNDLYIKDCQLHTVEFRDVEITSKSFHITTSEIKSISITGSPNKHNTINSLVLHDLNDLTPNFDFRLNNIDEFHINNCSFNKVMMNGNNIKKLNFEQLNCISY